LNLNLLICDSFIQNKPWWPEFDKLNSENFTLKIYKEALKTKPFYYISSNHKQINTKLIEKVGFIMINKILIVDDSPVARRMLKTCIPKDKGYEIFEASNGQDGIEKYKELHPDIVFMDLTMPVMDGYKATAKIKEIDKNAIIIVTTADIQPKSIASVMELGAFTLLKKPAKASSIQEAITKVELKINKLQEK